ncbi:hypothetical protein [Ruania rhizosphaerae]|uniref:hypothetical protein n=1 Tax=Ruania rhizosphaerae TaxID=1840413 RepID=UPI00135C01AC|nr:hypothetical protein [Ruania rhizosphaerae]
MSETPDLAARSAAFAEDVQRLLDAVLPHDKRIISVKFAQRYVIRPEGEGAYSQRIPLFIDGERYADLSFSLHQELDRRNEHLKTSRTDFAAYWRQAVADGREAWRRRQLRAAVRDLQHEAAETLRSCGWEVSEPLAVSPDHNGPYRRW